MQQTANERSDKGRVAVVDDDEAMLGSLRRILSFFGFAADAYQSAQAAIAAYKADPERYDAILTDLNMPGMDGLELMRQIKTIDKDAVIVVLTGFPSADNAISALRNGAFDFLEKPYSNEVLCLTLERGVEHKRLRKARAEYQQALERELGIRTKDLREALSSLEKSILNTLEVIVALLELKEPGTAQHSIRVARRTERLALRMGVPQGSKELEDIRRGALLHDIGKIGVPDAILNKPAKLTDEEMGVMKRHPKIGYDIVSTLPEMEAAAAIVFTHHERFDGKGYPRHLGASEISLGAKIFSIIDTYDALRFDRCYHKGVSKEIALAEIEKASGTQFDPEAVAAFKAHIDELDAI